MKLTQRLTAGALTLVLSAGLFAMPLAASADRSDRRDIGLGLGAVAAGLLLTQRDKTAGIIVAAGVALAASRHDDRYYDDRVYVRDGYRYDDRYNRDYRYEVDRRHNDYDRYERHDWDRNRNDRDDRNYRNHDRNDRYERDHRR